MLSAGLLNQFMALVSTLHHGRHEVAHPALIERARRGACLKGSDAVSLNDIAKRAKQRWSV